MASCGDGLFFFVENNDVDMAVAPERGTDFWPRVSSRGRVLNERSVHFRRLDGRGSGVAVGKRQGERLP